MNFTWYLHTTPGHITAHKQLNFLFNYSNILLREGQKQRKTQVLYIFDIWWCRNKCTDKKNVFIQSITNIFYETMKKRVLNKNLFLKLPNLKRKLSTWIVFFTEIMIYNVKLINHILTFLVKMRANILTIQPQ